MLELQHSRTHLLPPLIAPVVVVIDLLLVRLTSQSPRKSILLLAGISVEDTTLHWNPKHQQLLATISPELHPLQQAESLSSLCSNKHIALDLYTDSTGQLSLPLVCAPTSPSFGSYTNYITRKLSILSSLCSNNSYHFGSHTGSIPKAKYLVSLLSCFNSWSVRRTAPPQASS